MRSASLIEIAKDLLFPLDIVTQVEVIIAKRRAGKSYTMRRLIEQLLKRNQQVVIVDPKGDQWGIRSSANGKNPGFPVLILGGEHGDLPLEVNSGELIAKLVVEERVSVLLDLSQFRKHEIATFMTAFLEDLYRLKAREAYRTPVKLVVDEADAIAPQKPQPNEARMLGAMDDIVRRGGQRGIGCTLVTQRSAVLNKNVLTQAQILVVLRTIAPQDLAAVKEWIDVHGTVEEGKIMMGSLPSLPIGDAWFWSPGWPTEQGIFQRVHVLPIETFDSGATPKPGEKKVVPKNLADVDLDALKGQMEQTIEKAKQNDPALLKRRIAELEKAGKAPVSGGFDQKYVDNAVKDAVSERDTFWKKQIFEMQDGWLKQIDNWFEIMSALGEAFKKARAEYSKKRSITLPKSPVAVRPAHGQTSMRHKEVNTVRQSAPLATGEESTITGPEQRILDAIAWMNAIGVETPNNSIVAFLSKYTNPRSTGYTNPRGYLVSKGLIHYPAPGTVALTEAGKSVANHPDRIEDEEELHQRVLERLTGPQAKILKILLEAKGEPVSNEDLAQQSEYSNVRSTGYTNPRGNLHSFGLIEYVPGGVKASHILFL